MSKTWTLMVEEDPDNPEECILTFPPDLLAEAGWQEGDRIRWIDNNDGSWRLEKIEESISGC